jgi:multidrug efflux pump subunit AcrB
MWIVRLALRRPLSTAVLAILMVLMAVVSLSRMSFDIFPAIDIPVVIAVWNYPGLSAVDMERRVVLIAERAYSTTVNGIEHMESECLSGVGIMRIYFHPGVSVGEGIAQISAVSETLLRIAPPGIFPPNIVDYNAANVPVAQLTVWSDTLSEQELFDYGLNFARVRLFTIRGLSSPAPFGGTQRQVMVNINPVQLYSRGLSPQDVVNALQQTNVILPAGIARIGNYEYNVTLNGNPPSIRDFNHLPIKAVGNSVVYMGDVGSVIDGHAPQTNIVRVNRRRATFMAIFKHASASTMRVVSEVREVIPLIMATAPKGMNVSVDFDQSVFVRGALKGVVVEASLAALLVALMVLLFIGSWRSTLIVIISIPLCVMTAIVGLYLTGQTINIMSLGGLALAVGMLVDDATVEVENIHRNFAMGKVLEVAILDGARQIAAPAFVGTLAICIVFFPIVLLEGVAKYLFLPLGLSVVYSMLTSYLLSRTLVTTMARHLIRKEHEEGDEARGFWPRFNRGRDYYFDALRDAYARLLARVIGARGWVLACTVLMIVASAALVRAVGVDFFPKADAGMMKLHVRVSPGTRIEETERIIDAIERRIQQIIPPKELDNITDDIGLPIYYNLAFYQTDSIGSQDADMQISLKPGHHPTEIYVKRIREMLHREFPEVTAYFQAADIVSQVLNFGLPAPIDVQVEGQDLNVAYKIAQRLRDKVKEIPGTTDVRIAQVMDYPTLGLYVDRSKALQLGVTENDVAESLITSLSSSSLTAPNYWLNPVNAVNYIVAVETPIQLIDSLQSLMNTPLTPGSRTDGATLDTQFLSNVAAVKHELQPWVVNHYSVQRVIDVDSEVEGRDLGGVTSDVERAIKDLGKLPRGVRIAIRGQSQAMWQSFSGLEMGIVLAVILVYLLMVTNFQSWVDPFIIIVAVPGALVGVLWMLVLTHTTLNVESLMGAVMAVGVGVANGNLVITFANDLREEGHSAVSAAIEAGRIRLRPVLMTALAMLLGMLPTALALGEAGEQNAPLGLALIGGLIAATLMTLFVVPTVYSLFSTNRLRKHHRDAEIAAFVAQSEGD